MGGTERPERVDRPLSDAERTEQYEQRVHDYYSRPENRDKLDPFSRMSLDEIKRLYRPDPDDPNRPRAVVEGGVARLIDPANEQRDRPRWHEEPESVRRIRTDHEDRDAGDREPTGTELLEPENAKGSRLEHLAREAIKKADDLVEKSSSAGNRVQELLEGPGPTGTEIRQPPPIPHVTERRHDDVAAGDVVGSTVATIVACAVAVVHGLQSADKRRRVPDDAGH